MAEYTYKHKCSGAEEAALVWCLKEQQAYDQALPDDHPDKGSAPKTVEELSVSLLRDAGRVRMTSVVQQHEAAK
mgnify:CR=1 FL=1